MAATTGGDADRTGRIDVLARTARSNRGPIVVDAMINGHPKSHGGPIARSNDHPTDRLLVRAAVSPAGHSAARTTDHPVVHAAVSRAGRLAAPTADRPATFAGRSMRVGQHPHRRRVSIAPTWLGPTTR